MATKTESERVSIWRSRIKTAQDIREREKATWNKNLLAYRGRLKPNERMWHSEDPWVSVEMVHSSIRAAIPTLLYSNPAWTIQPTQPEMDAGGRDISWEKAKAKQLWLERAWDDTKGNQHVRVAMVSSFLAFGCIKVGFAPDMADDDVRGEFEYGEDGELTPDGPPDDKGNQLYVLAKGEYLKDADGEIVFDKETFQPILHPGTIMRELFFTEWVPWENMLFDPEGGNVFRNHRYVVEEWVRPLEQVQDDPNYRPTLRKRIRPNTSIRGEALGESVEEFNAGFYDPKLAAERDQARVRGWDIFDFETNRYMVLVDETEGAGGLNDQFLRDERTPDGIKHGPYSFLKWNEDPGRWYPRTDVEGMAKLELEYNTTRSQMLTHRNQSRARYLEVKNAGFDDIEGGAIEREKFVSGPSGTIVRVKSAEGIVPARKDALDNAFFQNIPNIRMDYAEVAGLPGESRGVADADTATQASLLASGADIRNNDRRDNLLQAFLGDIARKLLESAQANATQVQWARVAPEENSPNPFAFREIKPEYIQGDFDLSVVMGSTMPKNSSSRVQLLERIVTMIAQNPHIGASPTLMRRMFDAIDIRDKDLIQELEALGRKAAESLGLAPAEGGATAPGQGLGQIANQHISGGINAAAGTPTGARIN